MNKLVHYPKDLDVRFAHHPRLNDELFDKAKLFTPVVNRIDPFASVKHNSEKYKYLRRDSGTTLNKPVHGTGLWVSPITEDGQTEWYANGRASPPILL